MKRQRRPISSNTLAVSKRHHHRAHTSLMQGSVGLTRLFQLDHRWTRRFVASVAVFSMVGLGAAPALADAESPDTPPAVSAEVSEPAGVEQAPEPPSAESSPAAPAPAPAPEAVPATAPPAAPVDPPAAPPAEVPADPPAQSAASTAPAPRAMSDDSDPQPPYLRWLVVDSDGLAPVANTEIAVRKSDTLTATIADNVGQLDYSGADLDTRPGWFTVKTLTDDEDTSVTHDITPLDALTVRPVQAPAGFAVGDDAGWADFASTDNVVHDDVVQRLALTPPTSTVEEPDDLAQDAADDESTGGGIGILAVGGPEPGINAPFLYWNVANSGGDPVAGATFQLQGPRTGSGNWGTVRTVTDCVEAPCDGLDRDPDPGEFQVTQVQVNSNYRIQPTVTPSGDWTNVSNANTNTPTWNNEAGPQTHNFGAIILQEPAPVDIVVRARVMADPASVGGSVLGNIQSNHNFTVGSIFRLYENANNTQGAPTDFTCTITAGGECTITVTGIANFGKRYWVVQEASAPGTYINPHFYTGDYTLPDAVRRLVGLTKEISPASPTTYMPMTATGVSGGTPLGAGDLPSAGWGTTSASQAASFGAMANSLMNPAIIPKCEVDPLRVALVLDQSASINATQWTTFRNALVGGNDSALGLLRNANAQVSILGFGTTVTGSNGWHFGQSGPAALPSTYANLIPTSRPGGATNATNWDAAFSTIQSANATHNYDLMLFVTDGAPNYVLGGTGVDGYNVTVRSVEAPTYAANAIKNAGTRIVAVGVRTADVGLLGGAPNLRAISGITPGSDYIEGDWDRVQTIITDVVKAATCTLPIEVSKTTVSATGDTVTNAAGWEFTASHTGAGTTLSTPASQTTTAGLGGTAEWDLAFTAPSGQTASLTLAETTQTNWTLTDIVCTVAGIEVDVTITDSAVTIPDLTPASEKVFCTFTNTETPPDATVQLNKTWVITNHEGDTIDTFHLRGENDPAPYEWLTATPSLSPTPSPEPEPGPGLEWGKPYAGYSENDEVTISETASLATTAPPGCLITVSQLTSVNGTTTTIDPTSSDGDSLTFPAQTLDVDDNVFGITNTVTCTSMLTLTKTLSPEQLIASSGATPGDWMLTAAAADEATHTGAGTWTQPVTAATSYTLTEALATTPSADASLYVPRADGAWSCALAGDGALADSEWSEFGSVTVPLGQHVECAVENVTAQLTLLKFVDGGSAEPNTWNLHAEVTDEDLAERPPVAGSWSGTSDASGTGQAVTANTVLVKPGTNYALSESFAETTTNLAYLLDRVERWDDATSEWVSADPSTVAVEAGDHAIYRFVNEPAPAVNIPLTGGMSAALFSTWGTALIVLAALLTAAYIDRTRRQGGAR